MKTTAICLIALALLAGLTLAAPDSLRSQMMDWMDAPGETMVHGPWSSAYIYSGTCYWDLVMGDSFLVWCPGKEKTYIINPFNQNSVDTFFSKESVTPFDFDACASYLDSIIYFASGRDIKGYKFFPDSLSYISHEYVHVPWASFHYAEIEDSVLYSVNFNGGKLAVVNIANPESLFLARELNDFSGQCGLEAINGYTYIAQMNIETLDYPVRFRPFFTIIKADAVNSIEPSIDSTANFGNRFFGDLASRDSLLFYVNTDFSDYDEGTGIGYEADSSHLGIWGYDYGYTWSNPVEEFAIGVEVLNEFVLAVGFEHGFSIINYEQLGGMREVAYYRNEDSTFDFTHFALKDSTLFAMAHPRNDTCRLVMFKLDEDVVSGISDPAQQTALPEAFEISAYPNPFNSAVTIALDIPVGDGSPVPISVEIYDVNGRRVADAEPVEAGAGRLTKDTSTSSVSVFAPLTKGGQGGSYIWQPAPSLPSGVYLVRVRFDRLSDRVGRGDLDPTGTVATARIVYLK